MAKPTLLTVDDDSLVLRAVERDLKRQYAARFRVVAASSGDEALETLREIETRGEAVALLLADQRMPNMTGVEFLEKARAIFPDARRVLLTAYADTEAAIAAINGAAIDHYLLKPWDPPQECLYPALDGLLDDWLATYRPPFEGPRVIGNRWSPDSHALKDFLSRRQVPFQWADFEAIRAPGADRDARQLAARVGDADACCLPIVLFPDGTRLLRPTPQELAEKLGLHTAAERPFYDLVIVGGGPAGLAAAVYGGSEGLTTLLVEKHSTGGQAGTSSKIENYLGFPAGLSGADLARRATVQVERFGVEVLAREACGVRIEGPYRILELEGGDEVSCHALLIAIGVSWRTLGDVPNIDKFSGAGVYYGAATTEALSCREENVYVVGGANSAGQGAMHFSRFAHKVVMLVRGDDLRKGMSDYLVEQIEATPNIEVRLQTRLVGVDGAERLEQITLADDSKSGETYTEAAASVFVFIGAVPRTEWLGNKLACDQHGFLLTGPDLPRDGRTHLPPGWPLEREPSSLETNIPGVFVAGDVRQGSVKRVASSVGEGGVAVSQIHRYLSSVR